MSNHFSKTIRPQDDFFGWANHEWIVGQKIPEDRASWGSFEMLAEQAEKDVRAIVENCSLAPDLDDADAKKIGDLYQSFMDEEAIASAGLKPLHKALEVVENIVGINSFIDISAKAYYEGAGSLFSVYVWVDAGDPTRYVVHISQSGIGLPDEAYYFEERHAQTRKQYMQHIRNMVKLTGIKRDARQFADNIFELEKRLAANHFSQTENRDPIKTYNACKASDVDKDFPYFTRFLTVLGVPKHGLDKVIIRQPIYLKMMEAVLENASIQELKDWLAWRIIRSRANYLTSDIVEETFDFYSRKLHGVEKLRERWKRGIALVESMIGDAVGRLYVEKHYQARSREQMDELIEHLLDSYEERIKQLPWMESETIERALDKLAKFTPKVGSPKKWRNYTGLIFDPSDLFGNLARSRTFEFDYEIGRLTRPIDKDEWLMNPQTVNAYYSPLQNEIVFPAAILQPPFFSPDRDAAFNYGGIGAVIGHEIGHGFDDSGSQYDGNGALVNWWSDKDRASFEQLTKKLVEQYDGLIPRQLGPDSEHKVNGELTLGENIGDLGGISIAYVAFQHYLAAHPETVAEIDGFTPNQRFFIGWALSWRSFTRDERAINLLAIDPHSPTEFRGNIVKNVDAWYEAFGVTKDDKMWIDPSERVTIW